MLGGAGKPVVMYVAAAVIPIYAGVFYGIFFNPAFMVQSIAAGFIAMAISLMGLVTYKNSLFQGYRAWGLTTQKADGKDRFEPIVFDSYRDFGKDGSHYRYEVRDRQGKSILAFLDEPIELMNYNADEMIIDPWIQTLSTNYPTGAEVGGVTRHIPLCVRKKPGIRGWLPGGEIEEDTERIPIVHIYATNMTARKIFTKTWNIETICPPTADQIKQFQKDFEFVDTQEVRAELEKEKQVREDLEEMVAEKAPIWVRVKPTDIKDGDSPLETPWLKWIAVGAVIAVAALAVYWYIGIIPGWSFQPPVNGTVPR